MTEAVLVFVAASGRAGVNVVTQGFIWHGWDTEFVRQMVEDFIIHLKVRNISTTSNFVLK